MAKNQNNKTEATKKVEPKIKETTEVETEETVKVIEKVMNEVDEVKAKNQKAYNDAFTSLVIIRN